jgi:hypothetical protein
MSGFSKFMASMSGRIARVVAGVVLVLVGLFVIGDLIGWIVAVIGLVPLLAGIFDVCVISRLFGGPFSGEEIRSRG